MTTSGRSPCGQWEVDGLLAVEQLEPLDVLV